MVIVGQLAQRLGRVHPARHRRHDQPPPAPAALLAREQLLKVRDERVLNAGGVLPHPPGCPLRLAPLPASRVAHQLDTACPQRPLRGALDVEPDLGKVAQLGAQIGDGIDQRLQRIRVQRHVPKRCGRLAAQHELRPHHMLTGLVHQQTAPGDGDVRTERRDRQQTFAAGGAFHPVRQRAGAVGAHPDLHTLRPARRPPRHARRRAGELHATAEDLLQTGIEVPRRDQLQRHPIGRRLTGQATHHGLARGPDSDDSHGHHPPVGDHPADGGDDAQDQVEYLARHRCGGLSGQVRGCGIHVTAPFVMMRVKDKSVMRRSV